MSPTQQNRLRAERRLADQKKQLHSPIQRVEDLLAAMYKTLTELRAPARKVE
jgi:hypothetical protein